MQASPFFALKDSSIESEATEQPRPTVSYWNIEAPMIETHVIPFLPVPLHDLEMAPSGQPVTFLFTSPDCQHHSRAMGGKSAGCTIRGLPGHSSKAREG